MNTKCKYKVVNKKTGKIIVDGEGGLDRYRAMVNACNGKLTSAAHAGTMKVILNRAMGMEPVAVLEAEKITKSEARELEKLSHSKNGRPSANATKFFLERLEQLGMSEEDLTEGADLFLGNLLKHGDNSSTSRADYNRLKKYPKSLKQVEKILDLKF